MLRHYKIPPTVVTFYTICCDWETAIICWRSPGQCHWTVCQVGEFDWSIRLSRNYEREKRHLVNMGLDARKPVFGGLRKNTGTNQPAHPRSLISAFVIPFFRKYYMKTCCRWSFNFLASLCRFLSLLLTGKFHITMTIKHYFPYRHLPSPHVIMICSLGKFISFMNMFNLSTLWRQSIKLLNQKLW